MSQRISTAGMHNAAIAQMLAQQRKLSTIQTQVASGKRVQTPADDPIAATRIMDLQRAQAQQEQFGRNSVIATNRLQATEQALSDIANVFQRVRELAVRANSATNDNSALDSISVELRARSRELLDLVNRRDAGGEYLFSGYSTQSAPFARGSSSVSYSGDQGSRTLLVATDQAIADGISGYRAFMDIPEGNGTFTTTTGVHSGTGSIDVGHVVNAAAWVPGTYTIRFNSPADSWDVLDAGSTVIASGTYTPGANISFLGVEVAVDGAPAAGDTFVVAPAGRSSLFDSLDDLTAVLERGASDPAGRSLLNSGIAASLQQLDQGLGHVIDLRSEIGARLSSIEAAEASREALQVQLSTSLSELQDLDYADAVSRMNQQMVGLQAAQAAYTRIGQLSLFNYL